jgi:hypothetical protein
MMMRRMIGGDVGRTVRRGGEVVECRTSLRRMVTMKSGTGK